MTSHELPNPIKVPHRALVVVADETQARLFRNKGYEAKIALAADGDFNPLHPSNDGPAGKSPSERSKHEAAEATFAKHLADKLYKRAHSGDYMTLVLIMDPQTLGQIRPLLHKEVQQKIVAEVPKALTNAGIADIEDALKTGQ